MLTFKQYLSEIVRLETSAIELGESIVDQYLAVKQKTLDAMPSISKVVNEPQKTPGILSRFIEPAIRASMPRQGTRANNKGITPRSKNIPTALAARFSGAYLPGLRTSFTRTTARDHREIMGTLAHELAHSYQHEARRKKTISPILRKIPKIYGNLTTGAIAGAASSIPIIASDPFVLRHPSFALGYGAVGGLYGLVAGLGSNAIASKTREPRPKKMSGNILQRVGKRLGLVKLSRSDRRKQRYNAMLAQPIQTVYGGQSRSYWENADEINARVIGHAVEHLHDYHHQLARDVYDNMILNSLYPNVQKPVSHVIEAARQKHMQKFNYTSAPIGKAEAKHATKQFERIVRHHESELPADIHTQEGQKAYVEKHLFSYITKHFLSPG